MHALVETVSQLASLDQARKALAGLISGLDIQYDIGPGHPLVGRRMPDLDLTTDAGPVRMFQLLHAARPVLLNLGNPTDVDASAWHDRVQLVDARYDGQWELPVLGTIEAPTSVLVRPDGYVAWVGSGTGEGLVDALATWFGAPATPAG
jgi:hypothetical protein